MCSFSEGQTFGVGSRTLEIFETSERINRWIFSRFDRDLGVRVLETGSGIGNFTELLAARDLVVATDFDEAHIQRLRDEFGHRANVRIERVDLERPTADFRDLQLDSVLSVNVLEHIRDDVGALVWLRRQLPAGGKLCIYVPALPMLYGTLDEALGHHRRYTRVELVAKLERAGFRVSWCRGMNIAGIPGWYLSGKILKRRIIPARQVRLYDRLVPILKLEDYVRLPIAMNLTACAVAI